MPAPVRVAITGAAGQIGYSLLFRVASGEMLGPEPARDPPAPRDHARARRPARRRDGARRLRVPSARGRRADRRPEHRVRRRELRAARRIGAPQGGHGALRSAHDQRQDLHGPRQGALRERGGRHQDPGCRQPGEHQLPDRDEQLAQDRSLAVHRDDAARSQPGRRTARRQARRARHRHQEDDDLGQPLGDAVPRPLPLRGRPARTPPSS